MKKSIHYINREKKHFIIKIKFGKDLKHPLDERSPDTSINFMTYKRINFLNFIVKELGVFYYIVIFLFLLQGGLYKLPSIFWRSKAYGLPVNSNPLLLFKTGLLFVYFYSIFNLFPDFGCWRAQVFKKWLCLGLAKLNRMTSFLWLIL